MAINKTIIQYRKFIALLLFIGIAFSADASDTLVVMSYNVENMFHPDDDPVKNDADFTPTGSYKWTKSRATRKALKIARVITSANGAGMTPDIIGLCEIEGKKATEYLYNKGGLANNGLNYKWLCAETPDARGISTAILYNSLKLKLEKTNDIYVSIPDSNFLTRNILYAKLVHKISGERIHVLVNHWPSKRSGEKKTAWKREYVAKRCRMTVDSILSTDKNAKIVLMGDFNEEARSHEVSEVLCNSGTDKLTNLSGKDPQGRKSYKYKSNWNTIDHIIVSAGLYGNFREFRVCWLPFIIEPDAHNKGFRPRRTYSGLTYTDGYSDHLPVMAKFLL